MAETRSSRIVRGLGRFGVALMALTLAGGAGASVSGDEVRVTVYTDMTGDNSGVEGPGAHVAAVLAAEDAGRSAAGARVRVRARDHGGDSISAVRGLPAVLDEGADLVVGLIGEGVAEAVEEAAGDRAVVIGTGAASWSGSRSACASTGFAWTPGLHALTQATRAGMLGGREEPILFSIYGTQRQGLIRTIYEQGLMERGEDIFGHVYITDIRTLRLYATGGMRLMTPFYWDADATSRAWSQRFKRRHGTPPTYVQAAVYSGVRHYLRAVDALGTDAPQAVADRMRERPVDDFYARNGAVRRDGQLLQNIHVMEVKRSGESQREWDYYRHLRTLSPEGLYAPVGLHCGR